ncbi:MAG: AI-2E family transporter [Bacteroidota bacterium]
MDSVKKIYVFIILVTAVVVLIVAQNIIIPFVIAVLFWFVIRVLKKILSKIRYIKKLPDWIITIISSLILLSLLFLVITIITTNIRYLSATLPAYEENISKVTRRLQQNFELEFPLVWSNLTSGIEFGNILSRIFSTLTGLFSDAFIVLTFLIFILLEESIFPDKIKAMYPDENRYRKINSLIRKIDHSVSNYIAIKTLVSLLTGILSFFALLAIGVDAPSFWAFLIFILNFIPSIGSLIATFFPAFFALLQFGSFTPAVLVLAVVGTIQILLGNFMEPRIMGTSMNISPLVVFLTLILWGMMWGIAGMLLSVPITVILILIMSEFEGTRPIAILLSRRGKIVDASDTNVI